MTAPLPAILPYVMFILHKYNVSYAAALQKCELGSPVAMLSRLIDAPQLSAVTRAMTVLREVGACSGECSLTPLGFHLAALPLDVRVAKMLIYAAVLGCLYPAVGGAVTSFFGRVY